MGFSSSYISTLAERIPLVTIAFEAGTMEQDLTNGLHGTVLKFDAGLSANLNPSFC